RACRKPAYRRPRSSGWPRGRSRCNGSSGTIPGTSRWRTRKPSTARLSSGTMEQHQTKPACRGVIVPLVTPLDARGRLDAGGATKLVERVVAAGCAPFVGGTTGEAASLAEDTRTGLVEIAVAAAAGAELVYAGIAGNCLENCLERARRYARLGADVAVCHLPAYYPLDEEQMRAWYLRLADAC